MTTQTVPATDEPTIELVTSRDAALQGRCRPATCNPNCSPSDPCAPCKPDK